MNQLLTLLAKNRGRPTSQTSRIVRTENNPDETAIYLYDTIVSDDISAEFLGGVSAQTLVPQIRSIKTGTIRLYINSGGGDVFAGQAIAQAVRDTGVPVIAQIDALAASAATLPAMVADKIEIASSAFMMIHNAWTLAIGNGSELRSTAELLDKVDLSIAQMYSKRMKTSLDNVLQMMADETWLSADEAVAAGLADGVCSDKNIACQWDLSAYAHAPQLTTHDNQREDNVANHLVRQQQRLKLMAQRTPNHI
jgi:ATP-dependent protease ClpP protease subunit